MVNFARVTGPEASRSLLRLSAGLLAVALLAAAVPPELHAQTPPAEPQAPATPTYAPQSPEQLEQLVAPIALYPDSLVAAILPAATYPEQIVEADRWLKANQDLTGDALAQAVNQQPWDASVKALTAFPAVLGNMDDNLSWTSSLGDAYYNQPQDVMAAVQTMRQRAQAAGNLQSTPQQDVTSDGSEIDIEPTDPDIVYVPEYDPWDIYGYPFVVAWPGWYEYPGIWFEGPYLSFGVGFPIGFLAGFGWGWHHWDCNWHSGFVRFDRARYASHSVTFFNRDNFYRSAAARSAFHAGATPRFGAAPHPFDGDLGAARGYAAPRGAIGIRSGAFSGFARGGEARSFSARGRASFGGGAVRGGGGVSRGGGRSR